MSRVIEQAQALLTRGDPAGAEAVLRSGLRRRPGDAEVHGMLGLALAQLGRLEQAEYMLRRAGHLDPNDPRYAGMLGGLLVALGRNSEALVLLERVPTEHPQSTDARFNSGLALARLGRARDSQRVFIELIERVGSHPGACCGLADVLYRLGEVREARSWLRRALRDAPGDGQALSLLAMMSLTDDEASETQIDAAHAAAANAARNSADPGEKPRQPMAPSAPDKRLVIGFLSPDLRDHPVASFFEPLLEGLDRSLVEPVCYMCHAEADATTRRLQTLVGADHWRDVSGVRDRALRELMLRDGLDVVVDLAGYTTHTRVDALARRVARLQVSAIGYPHQIEGLDGWVVDEHTNPIVAGERPGLIRLDRCFLCYRRTQDAPQPVPRGPGPIRWGSFNNITKWSPTCLDLWARVLREIPDSQLVLKSGAFVHTGVRERIEGAMESRNVARDRLVVLDRQSDRLEHLASYNSVDISLDTFPYHGTTTTCESLFMGVPVVTLAGSTHVSRVGVSLLNAVGLDSLAARTADEFVHAAVSLAGDETRLANLRHSLRDTLQSSPLGDNGGYAAAWERAIRRAWWTRASAETDR